MLHCGECGYALGPFDKECPRCKRLRDSAAGTQAPEDGPDALTGGGTGAAGVPAGASPTSAATGGAAEPWVADVAYRTAWEWGLLFALGECTVIAVLLAGGAEGESEFGMMAAAFLLLFVLPVYFVLSAAMGWVTGMILRGSARPDSYRAGLLAGGLTGVVCFGGAIGCLALLSPGFLALGGVLLPLMAVWGAIRGLVTVAITRSRVSAISDHRPSSAAECAHQCAMAGALVGIVCVGSYVVALLTADPSAEPLAMFPEVMVLLLAAAAAAAITAIVGAVLGGTGRGWGTARVWLVVAGLGVLLAALAALLQASGTRPVAGFLFVPGSLVLEIAALLALSVATAGIVHLRLLGDATAATAVRVVGVVAGIVVAAAVLGIGVRLLSIRGGVIWALILFCLATAVLLLVLLVLRPRRGTAAVAMQVAAFILVLPLWIYLAWLFAARPSLDLVFVTLLGGWAAYDLTRRDTPATIRVVGLTMILVFLAVVGIRYLTAGGRW